MYQSLPCGNRCDVALVVIVAVRAGLRI